jgi:MYXO-CTERM domain-containing protein
MQVGGSATARTLLFIQYGDAGESVTVGPIPAPGALALLGVAGLAGRRRRA